MTNTEKTVKKVSQARLERAEKIVDNLKLETGEKVILSVKGDWIWIQAKPGMEIPGFKYSVTTEAYYNKPTTGFGKVIKIVEAK